MEAQQNMPFKKHNKLKRTEMIQNIFPDPRIINIKISYGKLAGKSQTVCKLNKTSN